MATAPEVRPELESGDRLTREEFHRRYCRRPDIRKAELINGVVYVPSPARWGKHGKHQVLVQFWLGMYLVDRPEIGVGDNDTIYLTGGHEVQPDAFLFRLTATSRARRSWWSRWQRAAQATTSTTRRKPTGWRVCLSTSSGVYSMSRSIGSACRTVRTYRLSRTRTV